MITTSLSEQYELRTLFVTWDTQKPIVLGNRVVLDLEKSLDHGAPGASMPCSRQGGLPPKQEMKKQFLSSRQRLNWEDSEILVDQTP